MELYTLVICYITMERSTMFNGKIHYQWPFSIAKLNYQRVSFFDCPFMTDIDMFFAKNEGVFEVVCSIPSVATSSFVIEVYFSHLHGVKAVFWNHVFVEKPRFQSCSHC